jgi:hypothetical protein
LISRERIDIENQEEVSALKIATGQTARKAALLAEKSRIISSAIRGLLEAEEKRKAAQSAGARQRKCAYARERDGESGEAGWGAGGDPTRYRNGHSSDEAGRQTGMQGKVGRQPGSQAGGKAADG